MADGRDDKGRFLPGNKFWTATFPFGAASTPPMHTAETLYAACCDYFDWTHDNPLFVDELVKFEGRATHEPVAKMRAMTNVGLCMHIGISRETWSHWRSERVDLRKVIAWADDAIYRQKFEGAAAGMLNQVIIARELGLADRQEHTGADGGPIQTEDVTNDADAFARRMARLSAGLAGVGTGPAESEGQGGT